MSNTITYDYSLLHITTHYYILLLTITYNNSLLHMTTHYYILLLIINNNMFIRYTHEITSNLKDSNANGVLNYIVH